MPSINTGPRVAPITIEVATRLARREIKPHRTIRASTALRTQALALPIGRK